MDLKDHFLAVADSMYANGWRPIPQVPGDKVPGKFTQGVWHRYGGWQKLSQTQPEGQLEHFKNYVHAAPDALEIGTCAVITPGLVWVDLDSHDHSLKEDIVGILQEVEGKILMRIGSKGFAMPMRLDEGMTIPNAINFGDQKVLEFLQTPKQVVCYGIHPGAQRPYKWLTEDQPVNTHIDELPVLTQEIADEIFQMLSLYGDAAWMGENSPIGELDFTGSSLARHKYNPSDGYFSLINNLASKDYRNWVPQLGLARLKETKDGYVAVPTWRSGGQHGDDIERRKQNLSIDSRGIRDWGDYNPRRKDVKTQEFSPTDLVMIHLEIDEEDALQWLHDRVFPVMGEIPEGGFNQRKAKKVIKAKEEEVKAAEEAEKIKAEEQGQLSDDDIFSPDRAGGLLKEIAEYALATALYPIPALAMMSAICVASTLYGRKFLTPSMSGINVYMSGVCPSGAGKQVAVTTAKKCLGVNEKLEMRLDTSRYASAAAIHESLNRHPVRLCVVDEFGKAIQDAVGQGGHSKQAMDALLSLYSEYNGSWSKNVTASEAARLREVGQEASYATVIRQPHLSVMGLATPESMANALTKEHMSDGSINRIIWMHVPERAKRKRASEMVRAPKKPSAKLAEMIEQHASFMPDTESYHGGNFEASKIELAGINVDLCDIKFKDLAAEQLYDETFDWQDHVIGVEGRPAGVYGRYCENVIRLATIRALSRDMGAASVHVSDIEWAKAIVSKSLAGFEEFVSKYVFENQTDELHSRVTTAIGKIASAGNGWATPSRIRNNVRGLNSFQWSNVIKDLIEMERIEQEAPGLPMSRGMKYRLIE